MTIGLITLSATAAAFGCSSNKATGPTAQSVARHLDSLYLKALAKGTHGDTGRATLLSIMELSAGYGAVPTSVTVTTAAGNKTWKLLSLEVTDTSGNPSANTNYASVAYDDDNVDNAVLSEVITGNSPNMLATLVANDTIQVTASSPTVGGVNSGNAAACPFETGLTNPIFTQAAAYHCNTATLVTSLNAAFAATPGVDASLTSVSYAGTSNKGPRLANATP